MRNCAVSVYHELNARFARSRSHGTSSTSSRSPHPASIFVTRCVRVAPIRGWLFDCNTSSRATLARSLGFTLKTVHPCLSPLLSVRPKVADAIALFSVVFRASRSSTFALCTSAHKSRCVPCTSLQLWNEPPPVRLLPPVVSKYPRSTWQSREKSFKAGEKYNKI